MNHPWITKGFNSPPENYLPHREPLQLPLDKAVIDKMTGFDFGTPEYITQQLTKVIQSDEYDRAVRLSIRKSQTQTPETERKRGVFDFYRRRNSISSRDTLTNPSAEAIQLGLDPVNAFSPLISVYYLVREKMERERQEANPGALSMPQSPGEKPLKMPDLPAPEAAYTNPATYEMAGEKPTGGRSRPRARTHGEDEVTEGLQKLNLNVPPGNASPAIITPPIDQPPAKKESTAAGLLRRFSTRRHRDPDRERRDHNAPPAVAVSSPNDSGGVLRKSFSVRRTRDKNVQSSSHLHPGGQQQPELLSPPITGGGTSRKLKTLGRSTSVNSADLRRRMTRRGVSEGPTGEPPATSGSDRSSLSGHPEKANDAASDDIRDTSRRAPASRTKSLGHARRESIQARRARREMAKESNVPEETGQELERSTGDANQMSDSTMKPVYLKGLFSVSTTSRKPLSVIQADIIRVLEQLGITYHEIRGGFKCRHTPSIDLNTVVDSPSSTGQPSGSGSGHRRRISFGGFNKTSDREKEEFREHHRYPQSPKAPRQRPADQSYTNTDESDESGKEDRQRSRLPKAAGETTTHVQSDLGGSMILIFEILIVKVPLLQLHGIQFQKVDGGTWQYKKMADTILKELRL